METIPYLLTAFNFFAHSAFSLFSFAVSNFSFATELDAFRAARVCVALAAELDVLEADCLREAIGALEARPFFACGFLLFTAFLLAGIRRNKI